MATFHSIPTKRLAESITSSDTSFSIRNNEDWNGETLDSADFDSVEYGVFRNETNTRLEFFSYDASDIENGNITIVNRGLDYTGDLDTEVSANKKNWIKGETLVELGSDPSQLYQYLKEYIDNAIVSGAADATDSVKGLVEIAEESEIDSGDTSGDTSARLVVPADSDLIGRIVKKRISSETSAAEPTINTDTTDVHKITALDTNITDMSANLSGTPYEWDTLVIEITATETQSITWGTDFVDGGIYSLPSETDGTTTLVTIFYWDTSNWVIIGIA